MRGARDLLGSERGVFCLLVLAIITTFVMFGIVDGPIWVELVKFLALTLVTSKTLTNINDKRTGQPPPGVTP